MMKGNVDEEDMRVERVAKRGRTRISECMTTMLRGVLSSAVQWNLTVWMHNVMMAWEIDRRMEKEKRWTLHGGEMLGVTRCCVAINAMQFLILK